jgi:signal peptidase II
MLIWIVVIVASVFADQLTKQLVVNFLDREEPLYIIKDVLRFSYVENRGAAFGMLDDHRWVFMIISTVAIVGLTFYMWKFCRENKFLCLGLSLIIGGGIGNMIDRVFLGYVIDFIDFCAFPKIWMWVFNVADACVCVGAAIVALCLVIDIVKESKKKAAVPDKTDNGESAE